MALLCKHVRGLLRSFDLRRRIRHRMSPELQQRTRSLPYVSPFEVSFGLNVADDLCNLVHVEGVLAQSDFQPELFTSRDVETGAHFTPGEIRRNLSVKSSTHSVDVIDISGSPPSRSLSVKKDSNWDFDAAMDRPPIYIVELGTEETRFKEMPHD